MPGNISDDHLNVSADRYSTSLEIPEKIMNTLRNDPGPANVVLSFLESLRARTDSQNQRVWGRFWIAIWSIHKDPREKTFDFLLSCTEGPLGLYPIFIYSANPSDELNTDFLSSRMKCLVSKLLSSTCTERVFSVFAPKVVTEMFCNIWTSVTDIASIPTPYYDAKFACCYRYSLERKAIRLPENWTTRPATLDDLLDTGRLCEGFAATSVSFIHCF